MTLCNLLLKYKSCCATHKNDVGKIETIFRIRLKSNAQLITQRPSKVTIHYRVKLNILLQERENITLSNKLVRLHKTNQFMAQHIYILSL